MNQHSSSQHFQSPNPNPSSNNPNIFAQPLSNPHQLQNNPHKTPKYHPTYHHNFKSYHPHNHNFHRFTNETIKKLADLSYFNKIQYICLLIKELSRISKHTGYFYINQLMLNCDFGKPILKDLSLKYDHIEKRIKPLHPIHKNKRLESQLQFVSELKKTLRIVFPTIDLGKNTTIQGFLLYMLKIQKNLEAQNWNASQGFDNKQGLQSTRIKSNSKRSIYHQRFSIMEKVSVPLSFLKKTNTLNTSCTFQCLDGQQKTFQKMISSPTKKQNNFFTDQIQKDMYRLFENQSSGNTKQARQVIEQQLQNLF